ncbi:transcription factor MYB48, putative [Entamoeba invadens IP1]|uniref:Transcription factor MYB48, putative n=1 Tax=Entamoeba invadens IP1 TaxID=370355 RepID=A0A0A1U9H7_ENTIV|nr:transcription factor MYB48, putative [Entamoeba invadens IP1]ELP89806.1 transcription factor MYB48, putative [Entamoeba invadens IP1]|eukprot:XP_004256577.1 transcription factor MYB48, putative [Entamoeba invadens IP1]
MEETQSKTFETLIAQTASRGIRCSFKKSKMVIPWSKEEDMMLVDAVKKHGKNWEAVSQCVDGRTKKQCKERFTQKYDPSITRQPWSMQEDMTIITAQQIYGNKWTVIQHFLPGRSPNNIKNRWFSHLVDLTPKSECSQTKRLSAFVPSNAVFVVVESQDSL